MPDWINHEQFHTHWVSSDTGWSNQNVDHYAQRAGDVTSASLCGGYLAASIGGPSDFIIHHTHAAQRATLPAGNPVFSFDWRVTGASQFGDVPSAIEWYLTIDHDFVTGENAVPLQSWNGTNSGGWKHSSISLNRPGHYVELQFRCEQPGHPNQKIEFSTPGTTLEISNMRLSNG